MAYPKPPDVSAGKSGSNERLMYSLQWAQYWQAMSEDETKDDLCREEAKQRAKDNWAAFNQNLKEMQKKQETT